MNLKYLWVAVAVLFALSATVQPQTQKPANLSVRLGDKTIVLPPPEGLEDVTDRFEVITTIFKASEPPQNDLLATFIAGSDVDLFRQGKSPLMHNYAKISVFKAGREERVTTELFEAVAADFRKNAEEYLDPSKPGIKSLIENFEKELSKNTSGPANMELGKSKVLGTFDSGPRVQSMLIISSVKVDAGTQSVNRVLVAGASLVHVKERILFVNAYRTYQAESDAEALKQMVKKWTKSILAANEGN